VSLDLQVRWFSVGFMGSNVDVAQSLVQFQGKDNNLHIHRMERNELLSLNRLYRDDYLPLVYDLENNAGNEVQEQIYAHLYCTGACSLFSNLQFQKSLSLEEVVTQVLNLQKEFNLPEKLYPYFKTLQDNCVCLVSGKDLELRREFMQVGSRHIIITIKMPEDEDPAQFIKDHQSELFKLLTLKSTSNLDFHEDRLLKIEKGVLYSDVVGTLVCISGNLEPQYEASLVITIEMAILEYMLIVGYNYLIENSFKDINALFRKFQQDPEKIEVQFTRNLSKFNVVRGEIATIIDDIDDFRLRIPSNALIDVHDKLGEIWKVKRVQETLKEKTSEFNDVIDVSYSAFSILSDRESQEKQDIANLILFVIGIISGLQVIIGFFTADLLTLAIGSFVLLASFMIYGLWRIIKFTRWSKKK